MPADWIQTFTRRKFYPTAPRVEDVDIFDIAHALARICRFTGHIDPAYTVAEHSIHCALILAELGHSPKIQLAGLLHDASEAYLCDVSRPVKRDPCMAGYRTAEARLEAVIYQAFGLPFERMPPEVKEVDNMLCGWEARDLLPGGPLDGWAKAPDGAPKIVPVGDPKIIKAEYLEVFCGLLG